MTVDSLAQYATTRKKGKFVKIGDGAKKYDVQGIAGVLANIRVENGDRFDQLVLDIVQEDGSWVTTPMNFDTAGLLEGKDVGSLVILTFDGLNERGYPKTDVKVINPASLPADVLAATSKRFPDLGRFAPLAVTPRIPRRSKAEAAANVNAYAGAAGLDDMPEALAEAEDDDLPF